MAHFSEGARDAWRIPKPHSSFDDTGAGASGTRSGTPRSSSGSSASASESEVPHRPQGQAHGLCPGARRGRKAPAVPLPPCGR